MNYVMEPLSFLAGRETLGSLDPAWTLDDFVENGGDRCYRARVTFSRPFRNAPLVHLGIGGFDISNDDAARLSVSAAHVTPEGFEIVLATWLHSKLWRVEVNWLAVGI